MVELDSALARRSPRRTSKKMGGKSADRSSSRMFGRRDAARRRGPRRVQSAVRPAGTRTCAGRGRGAAQSTALSTCASSMRRGARPGRRAKHRLRLSGARSDDALGVAAEARARAEAAPCGAWAPRGSGARRPRRERARQAGRPRDRAAARRDDGDRRALGRGRRPPSPLVGATLMRALARRRRDVRPCLPAPEARADGAVPPLTCLSNMYDVAAELSGRGGVPRGDRSASPYGVSAPIHVGSTSRRLEIQPNRGHSTARSTSSTFIAARSTRNVKSPSCARRSSNAVRARRRARGRRRGDRCPAEPPPAPAPPPPGPSPEVTPLVAPPSLFNTEPHRRRAREPRRVSARASTARSSSAPTRDAIVAGWPLFASRCRTSSGHPGHSRRAARARSRGRSRPSDDARRSRPATKRRCIGRRARSIFAHSGSRSSPSPIARCSDLRLCARLELGVLSASSPAQEGRKRRAAQSDHELAWLSRRRASRSPSGSSFPRATFSVELGRLRFGCRSRATDSGLGPRNQLASSAEPSSRAISPSAAESSFGDRDGRRGPCRLEKRVRTMEQLRDERPPAAALSELKAPSAGALDSAMRPRTRSATARWFVITSMRCGARCGRWVFR